MIAFLGIFIVSCSDEDSEVMTTVAAKTQLNVSYGSHERQVFDIYLPEGRDENTKVIILIHGGSWVIGSKENVNFMKDIITSELTNYAVVNMNYRLAVPGVSPFPTQLDDVTAVVNHLKANKSKYSISNELAFLGVSAGAHLGMLWSYAYDTDNQVNMVGSIVGPVDLTYLNDPTSFIYQLVGSAGILPDEDFFKQYSPFFQVKASSPPTILFHAGMDELVPLDQGPKMKEKLDDLGVINKYTLYPLAPHDWSGDQLLILDTWVKTRDFILKHHS